MGTMSANQPRYWDLFLIILLLLGAIAGGEVYFYQQLSAAKTEAAKKAEPPPPPPEPVAVATPAPAEPATPVTPPPQAPKPYETKVRSRLQSGTGAPVTYIVQGTNRETMLSEIALDAFLSAFDSPPQDARKASAAVQRVWTGWVIPAIQTEKVDKDEQGMVVTFKADPIKLKDALRVQGFSFHPTVPSFELDTNGSYAPDNTVIDILTKSLQTQSPYYVGVAMFANPPVVEKQIARMRVTIDREPYGVTILGSKDFGDSPVGQSILYTVSVLPQ